jgi:antitoxin PrlF
MGGSMKSYSITPKGQVTIPVEIREKLKLKPGDRIIYENSQNGVFLKPAKRNMLADFGFLKDTKKPKKDLDVIRKVVREKMAKSAQ